LQGIPTDSRSGKPVTYLKPENITPQVLEKVSKLNQIAADLDLNLAQLAVNWTLRQRAVTSALIGASRPTQIEEIVSGTMKPVLSGDVLEKIEQILSV
jgi:L-glyceraldehyde 3-phosphate reductase